MKGITMGQREEKKKKVENPRKPRLFLCWKHNTDVQALVTG